ncbi:hypothetical protein WMY93_028918 [Mugilogobius chulae]|uniref:Single-pass membrane and coiled-coil domain-containing protein 4 n=1 Tax=Mugilogobius chulae TaxID=88201 RepID=A0AAW0N0Q5_9GOBI
MLAFIVKAIPGSAVSVRVCVNATSSSVRSRNDNLFEPKAWFNIYVGLRRSQQDLTATHRKVYLGCALQNSGTNYSCGRALPSHYSATMRQLKGKPKKETSKDKKERKQAMQEARQQIATVVLPTLAVVVLLIVMFVYIATRPGAVE